MKKNFKKAFVAAGFTPMGIMAGMAITLALTLYTAPLIQANKFEDNVKKTFKDVDVLIDGVIGLDGYMHSTVPPCSDAITTYNLTASRLNGCKNYYSFELIDNNTTNNTNAEDSYFKILQNYGDSRLYFDNVEGDNTSFYIFMDLNTNMKQDVIERYFGAHIRENYPNSLRSIDWESSDITTASGGTKTDGKVRFRFKK